MLLLVYLGSVSLATFVWLFSIVCHQLYFTYKLFITASHSVIMQYLLKLPSVIAFDKFRHDKLIIKLSKVL